MTTVAAEWITGEELYEMADVGRCELVEGRIVEMSPTKPEHGRYEYLLARRIGDFVEERDLGQVMVGEVGIYTRRNPDTVRGPDVSYYPRRATPTERHTRRLLVAGTRFGCGNCIAERNCR